MQLLSYPAADGVNLFTLSGKVMSLAAVNLIPMYIIFKIAHKYEVDLTYKNSFELDMAKKSAYVKYLYENKGFMPDNIDTISII